MAAENDLTMRGIAPSVMSREMEAEISTLCQEESNTRVLLHPVDLMTNAGGVEVE